MPGYFTDLAFGLYKRPILKVIKGGNSPGHWSKVDIVFLAWKENIAGVVQKQQLAVPELSKPALKPMTSLFGCNWQDNITLRLLGIIF